ncbi:MAG: hypothetical protein GX483_01340 [Actinomycetaceae bacterium]|nr:hypothetical protein [Actinomycetaceae bacterium]
MTELSTMKAYYAHLTNLGTAPALVWYAPGERIELSGKVMANHIAKIFNLLSSEHDVEDERVTLDLSPSWKALVWALGAVAAGAELDILGPERADFTVAKFPAFSWSDVVVTDQPDKYATEECITLALNPASLAFAWDGDLPDGVDDAAAIVMGQADAPLFPFTDRPLEAFRHGRPTPPASGTTAVAYANLSLPEALRATFTAFESGATLVVINDETRSAADIAAAERASLINY